MTSSPTELMSIALLFKYDGFDHIGSLLIKLCVFLGLLIYPFSAGAQKAKLVVPIGHLGEVTQVAFSPDDRFIISGGQEGAVMLWETKSGKLLFTFEKHEASIAALEYSAEGNAVFSLSQDHTIHVSNARSGELIHQMQGPSGELGYWSLFPDRRTLLTSDLRGMITIWDIWGGRKIRQWRGHQSAVHRIELLSNDSLLVSSSKDGSAKIWKLSDGQMIYTFNDSNYVAPQFADDREAPLIQCSENGRYVRLSFAGETDSRNTIFSFMELWSVEKCETTVSVYDTIKGRNIRPIDFWPNALLSPDDSLLVTSSKDYTIALWKASTGTLLQSLKLQKGFSARGNFRVHPENASISVTFPSRDQRQSDTFNLDTLSRSILPSKLDFSVSTYNDDYGSLVDLDGEYYFHSVGWGATNLINRNTKKVARSYSLYGADLSGGSTDIAVSSDGNFLLHIERGRAVLWEVSTGLPQYLLGGNVQPVIGASLSSDQDFLLTTPQVGPSHLWNLKSRIPLKNIGYLLYCFPWISDNYPSSLPFLLHAGKRLVTPAYHCSKGKSSSIPAQVWDVQSGIKVRSLQFPQINSMTFTPDGQFLLLEYSDGFGLWDIQADSLIQMYGDDFGSFENFTFSRNGEILLAGGTGTAALIQTHSGNTLWDPVKELTKPADPRVDTKQEIGSSSFEFMTLSSNGKYLFVQTDLEAFVYEIDEDKTYALQVPVQSVVSAATFSNDDDFLWLGFKDGHIEKWNFKFGRQLSEVQGYKGEVVKLAISADGQWLIGADESSVQLWEKGDPRQPLISLGIPTTNFLTTDSDYFLTIDRGIVHVFQTKGGRLIRELQGDYINACFSPDGLYCLTQNQEGTIQRWDYRTGQLTGAIQKAKPLEEVVFSVDGNFLASTAMDRFSRQEIVNLYDLRSGEVIYTLPRFSENGDGQMAFSRDGKYFQHGNVLWDLERRQPRLVFEQTLSAFDRRRVVSAPKGSVLFDAIIESDQLYDIHETFYGKGSTFKTWDPETGRLLRIFAGHTGPLSQVLAAPDDRWFWSASADSTVRKWDAALGKSVLSLPLHEEGVTQISLSSDQKLLVSGTEKGHISGWDARVGNMIWTTTVKGGLCLVWKYLQMANYYYWKLRKERHKSGNSLMVVIGMSSLVFLTGRVPNLAFHQMALMF